MNGQRHGRSPIAEFSTYHDAISRVVCDLSDVLDELLDAETDTWSSAPIRDDRAASLITTLINKLRELFAMEEQAAANDDVMLRTLHQEHVALLGSLDYLSELTGSPCFWKDVESRFRLFMAYFADHNQREEAIRMEVSHLDRADASLQRRKHQPR